MEGWTYRVDGRRARALGLSSVGRETDETLALVQTIGFINDDGVYNGSRAIAEHRDVSVYPQRAATLDNSRSSAGNDIARSSESSSLQVEYRVADRLPIGRGRTSFELGQVVLEQRARVSEMKNGVNSTRRSTLFFRNQNIARPITPEELASVAERTQTR